MADIYHLCTESPLESCGIISQVECVFFHSVVWKITIRYWQNGSVVLQQSARSHLSEERLARHQEMGDTSGSYHHVYLIACKGNELFKKPLALCS